LTDPPYALQPEFISRQKGKVMPAEINTYNPSRSADHRRGLMAAPDAFQESLLQGYNAEL
jgi:hypothetical protein